MLARSNVVLTVCPVPRPPLALRQRLNPEETLVIVVSKTFTTAETMLNARTLKDWLISSIKGKSASEITSQHIVSLTLPWSRFAVVVLSVTTVLWKLLRAYPIPGSLAIW